jgi:NADH-quinone oxidoreductase subunit E
VSQPEDRQQGGQPEPGGPGATALELDIELDEGLYQAVQAHIARYPTRRAAILPALRLAQEREGWLSPKALRAVSEAIGFSPAYCQSVASFYDMFYLEPVGTHVIEVCTNITCAMLGAGTVMAALEEALGVSEGETTPDGRITLRKVECLGGCGYAPVVAVDERFHERFRPEDAAALIDQVRREPGHRG